MVLIKVQQSENPREPRCHLVPWVCVSTLYTQTKTFWSRSKLITQFLVIYLLYIYPVPCYTAHKLYRLRKKSLLLIDWGSGQVALYFRNYTSWSTPTCWQIKRMLIGVFLAMLLMIFAWTNFPTISTLGQTNCNSVGNCQMSDRYFRSWTSNYRNYCTSFTRTSLSTWKSLKVDDTNRRMVFQPLRLLFFSTTHFLLGEQVFFTAAHIWAGVDSLRDAAFSNEISRRSRSASVDAAFSSWIEADS